MRTALTKAQERRAARIDLTVPATLTDADILRTLTQGLPMAQGIKPRIVRHRGQDTRLTAFLTWREGVLLADEWRRTGVIPPIASEAASIARTIPDEVERARFLCLWVAERVAYANTAPGRVGYSRLVGAEGALNGGVANCQGFADAYYLLGTVAGLEVRHVSGWRNHQAHLWNAVRIGGEWRYVDVSRVSRLLRAGEGAEGFILRTEEEFEGMGFVFGGVGV